MSDCKGECESGENLDKHKSKGCCSGGSSCKGHSFTTALKELAKALDSDGFTTTIDIQTFGDNIMVHLKANKTSAPSE